MLIVSPFCRGHLCLGLSLNPQLFLSAWNIESCFSDLAGWQFIKSLPLLGGKPLGAPAIFRPLKKSLGIGKKNTVEDQKEEVFFHFFSLLISEEGIGFFFQGWRVFLDIRFLKGEGYF